MDTKNKPTPNKRKMVIFLFIVIFLKEKVGTLLIKSKETKIIKYGVINFMSKRLEKFESSNIMGKRIKHPPAGDGIP